MKTKSNHQIVVQDGKSRIANWTQEFDHLPTVGDRLRIPEDVAKTLEGYQSEAVVSQVEMDQNTGDFKIMADAGCNVAPGKRPLVILNASLLPERIHNEVENHVRQRLELPMIEWEESSETTPIIHPFPSDSQLRTPLNTLQGELRGMLNEAVKLAPC
ncbi:MAG: hypothetical protein ABI162_06080 [Luteolibacter sp.]